jgi:hypothetical protein
VPVNRRSIPGLERRPHDAHQPITCIKAWSVSCVPELPGVRVTLEKEPDKRSATGSAHELVPIPLLCRCGGINGVRSKVIAMRYWDRWCIIA